MTRKTALLVLAAVLALPVLAGADVPSARGEGHRRDLLTQWVSQACGRAHRVAPGFAGDCQIQSLQRRVLVGSTFGIAEYSFKLRVGPGPYDVIGIHRVVKESSPFLPIRTRDAVMMAPGDIWNFDAAFLTAVATDTVPDSQALPIFLAQHDVDVWGIDYGWTFVPESATDLSAFQSWGIERDARDLEVAMAVARSVRLLSGNGLQKMFLLGWSRGGDIGYVLLNAETQLPAGWRQVRGFIPVDIYLRTDVQELQTAACQRHTTEAQQLVAGIYANNSGLLIATIWQRATAHPADPSQFLPGMTNFQAALAVGAATYLFFPPNQGPVPSYHFTAGVFDAQGLPTGLAFTDPQMLLTLEKNSSPFQPVRELADSDQELCPGTQEEVHWDDHLEDVTVPVLYVGAGGGFGEYGIYTTTLLGSTDVETHVVSVAPRPVDVGHADIFLSGQAQTWFWQPILDWIEAH
jgi:pimeloyl-ACP methyl ester carboxylesterase